MKATITTKNGTTVSGQVTFVGRYIIALDAKLTAKEVDELAKVGATIKSDVLESWNVQIPRRIIKTYELAD